ncbi:MAG: ABC transporter permease [Solirubrobacterales bacterium]|nr:ABC transporter permease [Solirubrobacterales bacterium]OJU95119.1 MAG: hypothetical protein BGO23_10570 [Solirubrobacterales bacterium 67-14]
MSTIEAESAERPTLIRGPSAVGGGRRRFWDLLVLVAIMDFKKTFFDTALGYVWSIMRPLMLFGVLLFVFTQIFRVGDQVAHYPVLLLLNIVVFGFFQESTGAAVTSVVGQEGVVRKTQFPRLVIPLAVVLTGLFNLAVNLVAVLVFMFAFGVTPMWTWLLFPVALMALTIFTIAVSLILSVLYVRYRDVGIIWSVVGLMLFYGTPVLYPIEVAPEKYHDLLMLNPLAPIIEQIRVWMIDPSAPGAAAAAGGYIDLLPAVVIYVVICVLSVVLFAREAPRIAEEL